MEGRRGKEKEEKVRRGRRKGRAGDKVRGER